MHVGLEVFLKLPTTENVMHILASSKSLFVAACFALLPFYPPVPAQPASNDCVFAQGTVGAEGGCHAEATDCSGCCREYHIPMSVRICLPGNVFKYSTNLPKYYQAEVRYCAASGCAFAGTITCNHLVMECVASGPCFDPH